MYKSVDEFMDHIVTTNPGEKEFHQAVHEVVESIWHIIQSNPKYQKGNILDRIVEPERAVLFRVPWMDDEGNVRVNKGYRIEMNSALGPFKGGIRFHPSVTLSILKFLAFEQVFKNSLTTLPLGGGKGGSNFDPRGKSDEEVLRFCQSFMLELYRHIGPHTDVPAGDIGVGGREIGYLYGMYKKIKNEFTGVLTGKGRNWGGSLMRPQATGYGCVYFAQKMLATRNDSLENKTVTVSGYGNVGTYAIEKINELGGKVVTFGDEYGFVHDPDGITDEKLEYLKTLWTVYRKPAKEYADKYGVDWVADKHPWIVPCDVAMPTACENELKDAHAEALVKNGCICVCEGANMPCTPEAIHILQKNKVLYGPGKAANAGGVAVSGLEMAQNSMRLHWPAEEVDDRLLHIMTSIHDVCVEHGRQGDHINYVTGANIAAFIKVADAMIDQGYF
jgi:glutamate dehydrogenase (NADP+)